MGVKKWNYSWCEKLGSTEGFIFFCFKMETHFKYISLLMRTIHQRMDDMGEGSKNGCKRHPLSPTEIYP